MLAHCVVAPEDHDAILNERFHRYLNKVEAIHAADAQSHNEWELGACFACYAWNASPVDGTDVMRSVAAKFREFPFPLDIAEPEQPIKIPRQGQDALDCMDAMFPLLRRQRELFQIVNQERRERHREMKHAARQRRTFQTGDIVLVRRQVKSQAKLGLPMKLVFKVKGPCRVLGPAHENSHCLQKIPVIQGRGRPGVVRKESAMRLTKMPSTMVAHKRVDGVDTRLASVSGPLSNSPVVKELGLSQPGVYRQSLKPGYAFDRVAQLWAEEQDSDNEVDPELDSDDEDDSDDDSLVDIDQELQHLQAHTVPERLRQVDEDDTHFEPTDQQQSLTTEANIKRKPDEDDSAAMTEHRRRSKRMRHSRPHKSKKTTNAATMATPRYLRQLYDDIRNSRHKLFFIKEQQDGRPRPDWHLVQVDLDETSPQAATQFGVHHVRWCVKCCDDEQTHKPAQQCRFWPETHEITDGRFGARINIRPTKVQRYLGNKKGRHGWYQRPINLVEAKLVGPFDFAPVDSRAISTHQIGEQHWNELASCSDQVDLTNLPPT